MVEEKVHRRRCQVKLTCGRLGHIASDWFWTDAVCIHFAPISDDKPKSKTACPCCPGCRDAMLARSDVFQIETSGDKREGYNNCGGKNG